MSVVKKDEKSTRKRLRPKSWITQRRKLQELGEKIMKIIEDLMKKETM